MLDDPRGWEKQNRHHITTQPRDFHEFFWPEMFPEPHSTKQIEDAIAYALDGPTALLAIDEEQIPATREDAEAVCLRVRCPVLVVAGDHDHCQPHHRGVAFADLTGGEHVTLAGAGHVPMARHPVVFNRLVHDFVSRVAPAAPRRRVWTRPQARGRRALLVTSPIGLGHAWRDLAIARELRRQVPDLEIEWLAQPPVTTVLEACGETIHPASAALAPEAAHIDAEAGGHRLHAFNAIRRLDEIFCANFMVFHDVVAQERFDMWIADEAWEVDHFLHENPELKTAPYAWLTDFVGMLPMASGGEREAFLVADHNAEMLEHIDRHPRVRDVSIFVGDPEDIVPARFGPGLPSIRDWALEHFHFSGYITGFEPGRLTGRETLGYRPDERVCVVTVGGSGAGAPLLRRVIEAYPEAKRLIEDLRMVVVAGPRIDPATLPAPAGVEIHAYVHELYRHLAVCDLAVVQGGLTTGMELTAGRTPFLCFPLRDHFEQNHHVRHRLERYGAGGYLDFDTSPPEVIAAAIATEIGREVTYRPVAADGAERAAALLAKLI